MIQKPETVRYEKTTRNESRWGWESYYTTSTRPPDGTTGCPPSTFPSY